MPDCARDTPEQKRAQAFVIPPESKELHTFLAQRREGAELVERIHSEVLHVVSQPVVLGVDLGRGIQHDAGDRRGLRQPLMLHQQRQRLESTGTGRDFK